MTDFAGIDLKEYSYDLPDHRIARQPLDERDRSKLLVFRSGKISEKSFKQLDEEIPRGSLLVRNNTRVIQARIIFRKSTGASIEILCLEPYDPSSYEQNFSQKTKVQWLCMLGNAKKWKKGFLEKEVTIAGKKIRLQASLLQQIDKHFLIEFRWQNNDISFAEILENSGSTPIPPYLNRKAVDKDRLWYQTIYAKLNGSVAAPTAGLHFSDNVFSKLRQKEVGIEEVTLHVGAGTFRPVQSEKIADHDMHVEALVVTRKTIQKLIDKLESGITAIGTTSLRTLESLYWLGARIASDKKLSLENQVIDQWEPYESAKHISTEESLMSIIEQMESSGIDELKFATKLIIVPGYKFKVVSRLVTNFHQPGSTLLLLVAAFAGEGWKAIYDYALNNDFRFLSYGDSSILHLNKKN